MFHQPFSSSRSWRHLTSGLLLLVAPLFLASCDNNDIDIDALNAQALRRQKEVRAADSVLIEEYIADSSFTNVQRQPSGLCIISRKAGTGNLPALGQRPSVVYIGRLLNNQVFDQSPTVSGTRQPFSFTLGSGQVIYGFDQGVGLMRKGERATLLIPSGLAYGPTGAVGSLISPDTPLRFDVELIDIQ